MAHTIISLRNHLLSSDNVTHIVNLIMDNFTIVSSARTKCEKMISQTINKEIGKIGSLPDECTNEDIIGLIASINKKTVDDFAEYLKKKCPNKSIYRPNAPLLKREPEGQTVDSVEIVMTEDEINDLLRERSLETLERAQLAMSREQFFEYMSNDDVLRTIQQIINNLNQSNPMSGYVDPIHTAGPSDKILSEEEVKILIDQARSAKSKSKKKSKRKPIVESSPKESSPKEVILVDPSVDPSDVPDEDIISEEILADDGEEANDTQTDPEASDEEAEAFYNHISSDTPFDEELYGTRIKEIVQWNQYFQSKHEAKYSDTIRSLNKEKEELISRLAQRDGGVEGRSDSRSDGQPPPKKKSKRSKKGLPPKRFEDNTDPNVEYLDLEIDPSNDLKDMKNLTIKLNTNKKVQEIVLVDYYLPFNSHNITRYNNTFGITMGERMINIIIPPASYSIQTLLNYISTNLTFLDFSIGSNNIISISNKMNMRFSLIQGENSILSTLGFRTKTDSYSDRISYTASHPYNLESNQKTFFQLSGTSMDPIEMEFDNRIEKNCTIKKNRTGLNLKHMTLRFTDELDHCYDFIMPFNICFKITYV